MMSVARVYRIKATAGKEDALASAIEGLAKVVRAAEGCESAFLLRSHEDSADFLFIEKWASIDHHRKVLETLGPDVLDPVGAAMAGPPDGSYQDWVFG
jgi:heme oxygenase (mycobilin-producing)